MSIAVTLKSVKSPLDGLKLYEIFNDSQLTKLITSKHLLTTQWLNIDNEKQQLENYQQQATQYTFNNNTIDYKLLPVKYKRALGFSFGRVYPIKSLGLCTLRKEIRHTIGKGIYVDIDIENAHPNLVYQMCTSNDVKLPCLGNYISNREDILNQTMLTYKVDRDTAKNLFIIILYFGSFKTWLENYKLDAKLQPTDFIKQLINERAIYGKFIEDRNDDIFLEIQKAKTKKHLLEYNEHASTVSIWCQEVECRILSTLYDYCIGKKYIVKHIGVLAYDGMMLEASKYKDSILNEFSKLIKESMGYELIFTTKALNKDYDLAIPYKNPIESVTDDDDITEDEETGGTQDINMKTQDRAFFKQLETLGHIQCAEIYHKLHPNNYIYSTISGWYSYNMFNILESTGDNAPVGILKDISKTLEKHITPIRNRMKANNPSYRTDNLNITKLLININKVGYLSDVIKALKELYVVLDVDEKIDNNINLLAFSNKVFDASTCTVRDILPTDYICKNTKYEHSTSNATIQSEINDIIHSIFEDAEVELYFKQIKAQALFGNINERCIMQVGSGGNGKGIISTVETAALGDYIKTTENTFITSAFKQGAANPTLASSKGVRILTVSEPAEDDELGRATSINTPFLKLITGNDNIETRQLYSKNISFKPQFTPFIQCNTLPNIKKIDKGIMRRIDVVEFPLSFVENPIEHYERKINIALKSKLSSVLYAREYLLMLLARYTIDKGQPIKTPTSVLEKTNKYFTDSNPVKTYIESFILKKIGSKVRSSEMLDHYLNNSEDKIASNLFIKAMTTNGISNYILKGFRYFKDVELLEQ